MVSTTLYIATSKDGFIADKNGSINWLSYAENNDEDYGFTDFFNSVDYLVMGKRTYEQMLTFGTWPYEGIHTFVFSEAPLQTPSNEISFFSGTPRQFIDELPLDSLITRLWIVGGGELAASFEKEGLIDEYIVTILPIELQEGIPLGIELCDNKHQEVSCKTYEKGIIQKRYILL